MYYQQDIYSEGLYHYCIHIAWLFIPTHMLHVFRIIG